MGRELQKKKMGRQQHDLPLSVMQEVGGAREGMGVVPALMAQAAKGGAKKRPRKQSQREEEWVERWVERLVGV